MNDKLFTILNDLKTRDIFFGPQGFDIVSNEKTLSEAQRGFSIGIDNKDLSVSELSNWQPSWMVFARDTELGDPYFVDLNDDNLPVYTAFNGDNSWQTELVSTSLTGFVTCLNLLFENGKQTSAKFIPDENTLIDFNPLKALADQLLAASECEKFWQLFFDCYVDWLNEDDDF